MLNLILILLIFTLQLYGIAEWFGVSPGEEMDKVLPMNQNFPSSLLYGSDELFATQAAAAAQGASESSSQVFV